MFKPQSERLHYRFLHLATVNILSNLMVPLASLVDIAFLGHLSEIHHLAGVALSTVLFKYIYWTFGFLRMGTTGTTAQALGAKDYDSALLILLRNALIALTVGVAILLLQYPLRELGFTLLSATPEVKIAGQAYYNSLIWSAPATLLNFVFMGWFLGREQGGKVFWLSAVSNGSNVILDYFFIRQWGWESAGAGAATALSQYLMLLIGLLFIAWEKPFPQMKTLAGKILDRDALKASFLLNTNILIRTFALISTFALFTNLSSAFGTMVLTTNTLLMQAVTLSVYFLDGLAFATESLAGNYKGEGSKQQLINLVKLSGGVSLSIGLGLAIIFVLIPGLIFSLLTNHTDVIAGIDRYVFWLLPVLGLGSIAFMLDGYFLGLTEGRILRDCAIIAAVVGCLAMAINAWQFHSSHLLWLALSLFMGTRVLTLGLKVPLTFNQLSK
ncbi:guanitoxin biosynthesis MATE family efflux transporter GntT [Capilliphycus salinus ALCB114379]|uniref:guanitoxin biosynthesis MATE family efflux transporter GntT n=1 Tax=Capilliphycus salinus TaxID=2768948 RepID=UPI0039A4AE84